ncbi:hypothetical protein BYT27DRAFT_7253210 [Phlegmacium glaucopus]|nr:hypothetical protein BYT27DRAFT_7253210 [Phlegmacium glaucopus]
MPGPTGRLVRVYNTQERAAINPFKTEYLNATTPAARKTIAQVYIFPTLFNYWAGIGEAIREDQMRARTKELLRWLRNVWRAKKKPKLKQGDKYRLTDVLWWTREKDVLVEVALLMNLPTATTTTPGWLGFRLPASKNIIDAMTVQDKRVLEEVAEKMRIEGLPDDLQRKHMEDKWYSWFTEAAKTYEKEMGLLCISVVAYTGNAGQLVINIHDEIADLLKVPARSFEEIYPDKSKDIKRTLLEYLKTLGASVAGGSAGVNAGVNAGGTAGLTAGAHTVTMQLDPNGFPIAPTVASWNSVSKEDLEPLYRMYITQHYRLACRDRHRQAPFQRIAAKPSDFIDAEYLPQGITISDPRSMKLEPIVRFFQHITDREVSHGIPHAF